MDITQILLTLFGGLGLFLLGIKLMEDGLHQLASDCLRQMMNAITKNRWVSLLTGIVLTTLVQSSSATTSMVVGLINAGLTNLRDTLGFLLGANIGTTTTGQIIAFKLDVYGLPILGVGVLLYLFFKNEKTRGAGLSLIGFGMLFFGMLTMKQAIIPLQTEQWLATYNLNSIWSMLLGMAIMIPIAAFIHSGASIGILIALGSAGTFHNLSEVIPLILGSEIGTCAAACLASMRTNRAAKKSALAHVFFNTMGAVLVFASYPLWVWVIDKTADSLPRQIANMHSLSSVIKCLIFLPLLPLVERMFNWCLPDNTETIVDLINKYKTFKKSQNLDKSYLNTPSIALIQTHKELGAMVQFTTKMAVAVQQAVLDGKEEGLLKIVKFEEIVDNIKRDIRDYLTLLSLHHPTTKQSIEITTLLEGASEIERVADHFEKMSNFTRLIKEKVMVLDTNNRSRVAHIVMRAVELISLIYDSLGNPSNEAINKINNLEKQLEKDIKAAKDYYTDCLRRGSWNLFSDLSFMELLSVSEKICRHCRSFTIKYIKPLYQHSTAKYKFVAKDKPEQGTNSNGKV